MIDSIVTKTANKKYAEMSKHGNLRLAICGPKNSDCCHVSDLDDRENVDFRLGAIDVFSGTDLAGCQNFKLPSLAWFEIENWNTPGYSEDGWEGEYIQVHFNNKTRLQCDLTIIGFLKGDSVNIAQTCVLKDNKEGK